MRMMAQLQKPKAKAKVKVKIETKENQRNLKTKKRTNKNGTTRDLGSHNFEISSAGNNSTKIITRITHVASVHFRCWFIHQFAIVYT
jgi:hypothetical protein